MGNTGDIEDVHELLLVADNTPPGTRRFYLYRQRSQAAFRRGNGNAGRRAPPPGIYYSLAATAEFPASLDQGFKGTGLGRVLRAYLNLNAFRGFRYFAFKLFAKILAIFSATVGHNYHLLCFNVRES